MLVINVSIHDAPSSDHCNRDYVEVHSGSAGGPLLGHFCGGGNAVPANVTVGERLWIKFRSDDRGTTGGGFIAEYNLRELIGDCLGVKFQGDASGRSNPPMHGLRIGILCHPG